MIPKLRILMNGRGALHARGSRTGRNGGEHGRENAGVSSEMQVRILHTESPRIPGRTNLPLETLGLRPVGFSPTSRYSCQHSHFYAVHMSLRSCFKPHRKLPHSFKECVIAHWSSDSAPKISGAKTYYRSYGIIMMGRGAFYAA